MSKAIVRRGRGTPPPSAAVVSAVLADVRRLIEEARCQTAVAVNGGLTFRYWRIGDRIRREVLKGRRAEYGDEIVATLSRQLSWSHFRELLPLDQPLQRDFYAET